MGMLFNTPGTVRILAMLTDHFSQGKFATLQQNQNLVQTLVAALQDPVGTTSTFSIAQMLGVDRDPGGDASVNNNWSTWLDGMLDTAGNQTYDGTMQTTAVWIRNAIAVAVQDPTCVGIEFFAVPGPRVQALLPFQQLTDATDQTKHTVIISMQTLTVDRKAPH